MLTGKQTSIAWRSSMWLWAWAREAYSDSSVEDGMRLFVVKMKSHKSKTVSLLCDVSMRVRCDTGGSK